MEFLLELWINDWIGIGIGIHDWIEVFIILPPI